MQTITFATNSIEEFQQKIKTASFQPTLGFVFASVQLDLDAICRICDDHDIDLMGCSTAGEFMNEELHEASIVCILTDMNKDYYQVVTQEFDETPYTAAVKLGDLSNEIYKNPAIIVVIGGVRIDAEKIIWGIKDSLKREIPIFGGLAGDDWNLVETYALSRKGKTPNGLTSVVLNNDKIAVQGLATSGWEPIGAVHTITKSKDNVVYTINNEPALDVFVKYFGYFDNAELKGVPINTMSAQYPLQIIREDEEFNVLRSPLFHEDGTKSLTLAGGVREGDKFRFSISPGFEVIDQTLEEFEGLRDEIPEADLMLLFSCKGRHAALGPLIEDEIEGIYEHWKAPMIGFFSYGEIGNVKNGICDFHNESCALVVLKEK